MHQKPIWHSDAALIAAVSGHGGGKTMIGPYWIEREWERHNHQGNFIICGPTYGTLRKSAIPKWLSLMTARGFPEEYDQVSKQGYRKADHEYRLPGGSTVFFVSADRPGAMQGVHAQAFWMDETVNTTYEVFETLLGRIALHAGRGLITTTPYDMGWLYENVYKQWVDAGRPKAREAKEIFVHQWRSIDNPMYPKSEWNRLRKRLPPWRFRMLYEGRFERPMGLVYDCVKEEHWIEPFDIPSEWPRILGVDWGFKDPMACISLALSPSGDVFAYDEFYKSGWMVYETAESRGEAGAMAYPMEMIKEVIARSKARNEQFRAVYCDPSRPEYILESKELFYDELHCDHVFGADNTVLSGIERCYTQVRTGKFHAFNTLSHFKDEVEKYQWETDKETGEPIKQGQPLDKDNHLMDAWRYALMGSRDEKKGSFGVGHITASQDALSRLLDSRRK